MPSQSGKFTAADPALGYLYQVRCALMWSLQRLRTEATFEISIEALDDVAFENKGSPEELLQTKHHKNRSANLTDASSDLWKTLRVWIESTGAGKISSEATLCLVTTEQASPGSIAKYLGVGDERDIDTAITNLEIIAQTSTSQSNADSYKSYLEFAPEARTALIERVIVVDSAPAIDDLDTLIKDEIFWAAPREHQETFVKYLEGWWFGRVVTQLSNIEIEDRILSEELETQIDELRDNFKQDSLPIADDLLRYELDEETAESHQNFPFVHQIGLATSNRTRIAAAIRDYFRAFEQRSRWQRQDLLFVGDLSIYEKALIEEWELVFAATEDEIGTEATELVKSNAAKNILGWVESSNIKSRIRAQVSQPFITRGSLHILANDLRIGWHPEFYNRLEHLLEGESSEALE